MADNAFKGTGDKYIDGRLFRYSDPARLEQTIKEAAAQFEKGKDITEQRNLMIKYFETHGRFVFIPGKGWLDLMHVASAYAASRQMGWRAALIAGWVVELGEWSGGVDLYDWLKKGRKGPLKLNNQQSGFQAEDIRSNRVGALMAITGKDVRGIVLVNKIPTAAEAGQMGKAELLKGSGSISDVMGKQMQIDWQRFTDAAGKILDRFSNVGPGDIGVSCPAGPGSAGEGGGSATLA